MARWGEAVPLHLQGPDEETTRAADSERVAHRSLYQYSYLVLLLEYLIPTDRAAQGHQTRPISIADTHECYEELSELLLRPLVQSLSGSIKSPAMDGRIVLVALESASMESVGCC